MMQLAFTKMHGAGNDFIVVNAMSQTVELSPAQWRALADRHFGIGADQILIVGCPKDTANDFSYRIINADGDEVEHCGNGARAFMRYVVEKGLTDKQRVKVEIQRGVIELSLRDDGQVLVAMGVPEFQPEQLPFLTQNLSAKTEGGLSLWPLHIAGQAVELALVSMGNPHAVQVVADVEQAPVTTLGPLIEQHERFPARVNAGFMQIVDPHHIRLRVWERGSGETLACGTGACAAVVTGIERGLLQSPVMVQARGGLLEISWAGRGAPVMLAGPAVTVFEGEITIQPAQA
jgi:diaminopimelate epimerase